MTDNRKRVWETFEITGLEPILVTSSTVDRWIIPDHPLHEAYEYLSPVHRADYLRAYLMFCHGGGYADLKAQRESWRPAVGRVLASERLIGAGYRELSIGTVQLEINRVSGKTYILSREVPVPLARLLSIAMRAAHSLMIGNCAFYFKPRTRFAHIWLAEAERRLDLLLPQLRKNPARDPRDRAGSDTGYPVPWTFLLGDILHPLALRYASNLSRDLPTPSWEGYM
jgi:hypothetical protein